MFHPTALKVVLFFAAIFGVCFVCGIAKAGKPAPYVPPTVNGWYAGPQIGSVNYSPGIVLQSLPGGVLQFDIPPPPYEIDGLVKAYSILPALMTISYSATGVFAPSNYPGEAPTFSVMFQRCGDDWSARKRGQNNYSLFRWYYTGTRTLTEGSDSLTVDFTDPTKWSAVYGEPATANLADWNAARSNVCSVHLTFGAPGGREHGITGPGHFNLWSVQ